MDSIKGSGSSQQQSFNKEMLPFFKEILGNQGAEVIARLAKASKDLGYYMTPRIIVSWLRQSPYGEVVVPAGCPLKSLVKSGYGYSGTAEVQGLDYSFKYSQEEHVAAIIAVASNQKVKPVEIKDVDLARLAKTIDLLVKSAPKAPANQYEHTVVASNLQPEEPVQPTLVQPAQNQTKNPVKSKIPKLKKKPLLNAAIKPLKVTKSEAENSCVICGQKMFSQGKFVGCVCFAPMAKSVKTIVSAGEYLLTFDDDWDEDAYLALIGNIKNGN
jgi:hypothetical protein